MNTFYLNHEPKFDYYNTKVLICNFAISDQVLFGNKLYAWKYGFQYAEMHKFTEQVAESDAIIFNGGSTPQLLHRLNSIPNWQDVLQNKIICAHSAGISALMKWSFNVDHNVILKGLGILPFKSIVHYSKHRIGLANLLEKHPASQGVPMMLISDYDSITLVL